MTSNPSRRTVLRTAAWATPAIAVAAAAPTFAASTTDLFRFNVVGRQNGVASINVTNLTSAPITVRVALPFFQPESNLAGVGTPPQWVVTAENNGFVLTTVIAASGTSPIADVYWNRNSGNGNYTMTASSGAQTFTTTLPYAAPAVTRTNPRPLTGTVMHMAPAA